MVTEDRSNPEVSVKSDSCDKQLDGRALDPTEAGEQYRLITQIVDLRIYYSEFRTRVDLALIRQIQR